MDVRRLKKVEAFDVPKLTKDDRICVQDSLDSMYYFGNRMLGAYDLVKKNVEMSLLSQFLYDGIKANLNDYVQSFLDIVAALFVNSEKSNGERISSLRQAIRFYVSNYENHSEKCTAWIEFLQRRNELVYECYNYEFMLDELKQALVNYSDCITELTDSLRANIEQLNLQNFVVRKGRNDF